MPTRRLAEQPARDAGQPRPAAPAAGARSRHGGRLRRLGVLDPLEAVALVARDRREMLLATHAHRLGREELEDCYSQATLEMLARAQRPHSFAGGEHIANALEQRLCSRIKDRQRALGGRSPIQAAMARALPVVLCGELGGESAHALIDERADVERIALLREELGRIARFSRELTRDQRLLLACQLSGASPAAFCAEHGWSLEKYRKVGQRARAHLSRMLAADSAVPPAQRAPIGRGVPAARSVPDTRSVPVARGGRIGTHGPAYAIHSPTA